MTLAMSGRGFAQRSEGNGPRVGVPVVGTTGIQETVQQINARGAVRPRRLRIHPEVESDRRRLPQNPASPYAARWPLASGNVSVFSHKPVPLAPQIIGTNFTGGSFADTFAIPPDSMGAVGPTQFIVAVNGLIRTFNKSTGVADGVMDTTTDSFFASVTTPPDPDLEITVTSDPRIRYDRLSGRWFIDMIDATVDATQFTTVITRPNRILFAVSDAASAGVISLSTVWTFFFFQADATKFADYDTLGIDNNALYIGANMHTLAQVFTGTNAYVVRKSSILGTGPIVVTTFANLTGTPGGAGPFTPQGVDNFYDPSATEGYFIGIDNAQFGNLVLRRIGNPDGTPSISGNINIAVNATNSPITVPHLGNLGGTDGNLDAIDDRLFAAQMRGGHIWTAHNIQVDATGVASVTGGRDGTRWYEIENAASPGTPSVRQSGTIFDSAARNPLSYWMPSIAVSGQGHVAAGFSAAGAGSYINAATVGRLSGDALGTMQGVPVLFTASTTSYNPFFDPGGTSGRRWGDYSYTSLDPNDDMTLWTIQEFCDDADSYGVRVAKLVAPSPATPDCTVPAPVTNATQNVTINGISVSGSGFFDPGPGFLNRLQASVSGGVTVNSVTFNNPTSVTLNVTATTDGLKDVSITNPDGQNVVGSNCISVVLGAAIGDLSITKTDLQTTAVPGAPISYTITASNALGPSGVTGATVTDTLPATISGVSWTCVGAGGGNCTPSGPGNINDTVNLPVGGSVTYTLTGTINSAATGSLSNTATVAVPAGVTDPNSTNNSATDTDTLTPQANLAITKTDGQTAAVPGAPITYTIVASNAGPSAVTGATVTDTPPSTIIGASWTCAGNGGGSCTTASGFGNINGTVNLPVSGTVTYTLTGTVSPSATGTLSNTATVGAPGGVTDPNLANNSATDTDTLAPTIPQNVHATAQTTTTVLVTWNAVLSATSYQVFRNDGAGFGSPMPTAMTSFTDTGLGPATSHLYLVRAVNGAGSSGDSAADLATTVIFADDPLVGGTSTVDAVHLQDLRDGTNAVRHLAGKGDYVFTDTAAPGLDIEAVHITEIRSALDEALGALSLPTGGYTDPLLTGLAFKAIHFQEIRDRMK